MIIRRLISLLLIAGVCITLNPEDAMAWGQKGHDVTCAIAQNHLSRKAEKRIAGILDGKSLVYWANWLDNASHTQEFAYTKTWHYKNIDADEPYESAEINADGDVLTAINAQIAALKSGTLSKDAEALSLKMLVHLVGDLHCPMHMGHRSDIGGNRWQVQFFNNGKNLHGIWDSDIIEKAHRWTFSEWADQIDREDRKGIASIIAGTPEEWGKETFETARLIYDRTPVGAKLSYDYVAEWTPVIEEQLLKGGLRLAAILNEIYR